MSRLISPLEAGLENNKFFIRKKGSRWREENQGTPPSLPDSLHLVMRPAQLYISAGTVECTSFQQHAR